MPATGLCADCPLADSPQMPFNGPSRPDLVLVGGFPGSAEARAGVPFSRGPSTLLRRVMADLVCNLPAARHHKIAYACAARCSLPADDRTIVDRAAVVQRCAPQLLEWLDRAAPKAVVALGNDALAALGFRERAQALRGSIRELSLGLSRRVPVVATYHILDVDNAPGLLPTLRNDLLKALRLLGDAMTDLPLALSTPITLEHILEALERGVKDIRTRAATTGKPVPLAVYIEPFSHPSDSTGRVLSVGLSWAAGQGLAFPLAHPAIPFSDTDVAALKNTLSDLLTDPAVRLAACDAKTVLQWLTHRYGLALRGFGYDVLLAEHLLEEDKGGYDLPTFIRDRFPSLARHEARRAHLLADLATEQERRHRAEQEKFSLLTRSAMESWWLDLAPDARLQCLGAWVDKKLLRLSETYGLQDARRIKRKGKWAVPQRCRAALDLMLSKVPPEEAPGFQPPVFPVSLSGRYEKDLLPLVPPEALLTDSAVRAAAIRMLIGDQLRRVAEDDARVARARSSGGELPSAPSVLAGLHGISLPLATCLAHMEYHGIRFDREQAVRYAEAVSGQREATLDAVFQETGRTFNPACSAPDAGRLLYDDMGLPVLGRTASGLPATDAATLAELAALHSLPVLEKLLAYRQLDACLHTLRRWLACSAADGRIHAVFNQTATPTFRVTCSRPNLQSMPAEAAGLNLKALFLPDSDAYELYLMDICHADLRVLAAYSRDGALIHALRDGKDPHSLTAEALTAFSYTALAAHKNLPGSEEFRARQLGKKVNFGIIYGISPQGLRRQLWSELRLEVSEEACRDYLHRFFTAHPGVAAYIAATTSFVRHHHFTTTFTGRRRRFPLAVYTATQASRMARQAVNARVQITTADLVARNVADVQQAVLPLGGRMLLTIYDALLFQLPKDTDNVKAFLDRAIIENTARRSPWLPVPWAYDAGRGPSYGETDGEIF